MGLECEPLRDFRVKVNIMVINGAASKKELNCGCGGTNLALYAAWLTD